MQGQRLGEFEEVVLLSIRTYRDAASGVGIQESLERDARRSASLGAIYTALDRLERKGLVESWLGDPTPIRGGRRKRMYRLTKYGSAALADARRIREAMWSRRATRALEGGRRGGGEGGGGR